MNDYSETIFKLVEYELWTNFRLLDFLERLSEEEYNRDFGFGLRTPHQTIVHIAKVMEGWGGCVGPVIQEPSWKDYDQPASLSEVRKTFESLAESLPVAAKAAYQRTAPTESAVPYRDARYASSRATIEHDYAHGV